jgi:hypothetical protein
MQVPQRRPFSGSNRIARGLSLMDGAGPQENSRVYPGSGGDPRAMASEWSVPGPPVLYRELALLTKFMISVLLWELG